LPELKKPAFFDLTGHVALITGGNGGIGLGYARGLARAGATLAIWGRDEAKNTKAVQELELHQSVDELTPEEKERVICNTGLVLTSAPTNVFSQLSVVIPEVIV
jgi:NAD(P)-dependent dehydrogenase (short-subunit alcohol dehydrogenase family)